MLLKIDLQDGFSNDTVVIQVNNKEVYRKRGITTKKVLEVADSFELDITESSAIVKIAVPSNNLSEEISVELKAPTYLGLSVMGNRIAHVIDLKPFAYF